MDCNRRNHTRCLVHLWLLMVLSLFYNPGNAMEADPPFPAFRFVDGSKTGGVDLDVAIGTYGTTAVASVKNNPGARDSPITWTDSRGRHWLYGGKSVLEHRPGVFGDLWMLDPATGAWAWMAGSEDANPPEVFGAAGEFAPHFTPGAVHSGVGWVDNADNLWMFGGLSVDVPRSAFSGSKSHLWKFDTTLRQWAVMKINTSHPFAVYGTKGVPGPTTSPSGRMNASAWTGADGRFWLYGGAGYASAFIGDLGDLWVYDPATNRWTWIAGSGSFDPGSPLNPAPGTPYYRSNAASWTGPNGNLYLFGGSTHSFSEVKYHNDLWRFSVTSNSWTFLSGQKREWNLGSNYTESLPRTVAGAYGQKGVFSNETQPGSRDGAATWLNDDGSLQLFGGYGAGESGEGGLNDVWTFNTSTNQWAWTGGSKLPYHLGRYGIPDTPTPENLIGGRHSAASWKAPGQPVWIFGGYGFNAYIEDQLNDVWTYEPEADLWTWVSGNHYPSQLGWYGTPLSPSKLNHPGTRQAATLWTPPGKFVWLFGGEGFAHAGPPGLLNDLWRFNTVTGDWTYIKGAFWTNHEGSYPAQGVPRYDITPSARKAAARWTDLQGRLWLFGGMNDSGSAKVYSDLWVFHPHINSWEWVAGPRQANDAGTYGSRGTARPQNNPPARSYASSWLDLQGNLWLFGGQRQDTAVYGDMWKFDVATRQWTWVAGPNSVNQPDVYGNAGIPSQGNSPNGHFYSSTWTDTSGNFWLFGGAQRADMWKFDPLAQMWTWMGGPGTTGLKIPVYGTIGVPSQTATPGSRTHAATWSDLAGDFWLFGGQIGTDVYSDLWHYSITSGMWTFVKGRTTPNTVASFGPEGSFLNTNIPGARHSSAFAQRPDGSMWLFGGHGYDYDPAVRRNQSDLWEFDALHETSAQSWELYE